MTSKLPVQTIRFVFFILLLTGCQKYTLHVHTEYVGCENLASYHVGTPDPMLYNPPVGQRLMVTWKIPSTYLNDPDLHLHLTIRFRNREEKELRVPVTKNRGMYIFPLLNSAYCTTGGIRSYKVVLMGCEGEYQQWTHHLWMDLIHFENTEEN